MVEGTVSQVATPIISSSLSPDSKCLFFFFVVIVVFVIIIFQEIKTKSRSNFVGRCQVI